MLLAAVDASDPSQATLGLLMAGSAAALWAGATVLYARAGRVLPPLLLNAIKGVFASGLYAATLWLLGVDFVEQLRQLSGWRLWVLAVSGVVGIAVGDSFYFASVNRIGASRLALISLLATPLTVIGGVLILGERLAWPAWVGIAMAVAGVAWVVAERRPKTVTIDGEVEALPPRIRTAEGTALAVGITFAVVSAFCQAGGALMNRRALDGAGDFDPLTSALWRLGVATVALLPIALLFGRRRDPAMPHVTVNVWLVVAVAGLMGTYGGIWLQQGAFAKAPAGPVQTLLSTTPIWVLPIAALAGERVTRRAVLGAVVAVAGVALLTGASWVESTIRALLQAA